MKAHTHTQQSIISGGTANQTSNQQICWRNFVIVSLKCLFTYSFSIFAISLLVLPASTPLQKLNILSRIDSVGFIQHNFIQGFCLTNKTNWKFSIIFQKLIKFYDCKQNYTYINKHIHIENDGDVSHCFLRFSMFFFHTHTHTQTHNCIYFISHIVHSQLFLIYLMAIFRIDNMLDNNPLQIELKLNWIK